MTKNKENGKELKSNEKEKDYKEKYLYLLAEYDNFRKRCEKEKQEISEVEILKFTKEFLPLLDSLQAIVEKGDEKQKQIANQVISFFKKIGFEEIDIKEGETFDYNIAEAMLKQKHEKHEKGRIVKVLQKGYKFKQKVIRYAKVIISE